MRELFGGKVTGLTVRRDTVLFDHCDTPLEFREYWKRNYGPTIAAYRFNEDRPERVAELDRDFLALLKNWNTSTEPGRTAYQAEYLWVTATTR